MSIFVLCVTTALELAVQNINASMQTGDATAISLLLHSADEISSGLGYKDLSVFTATIYTLLMCLHM